MFCAPDPNIVVMGGPQPQICWNPFLLDKSIIRKNKIIKIWKSVKNIT